MAKTVNDVQLSLAYRLGENSIPSNASEIAKRLAYIKMGLEFIVLDKPYWFMLQKIGDYTVANQERYGFVSRVFKIEEIKVDGYQYDKVARDEIYTKFEAPTAIVPILPSYMKRTYYLWNEYLYLIPTPDSDATEQTLTSVTSSGTTCTATLADHGYADKDIITIAGANETAYNGEFTINYLTSSTFSYTAASTPSATPATGTVTATKANITCWCYRNPDLSSFTSSSSIVIPDEYENMLSAYAEFRYWSAAHKRGKAADAEGEFREYLFRLNHRSERMKYGQ